MRDRRHSCALPVVRGSGAVIDGFCICARLDPVCDTQNAHVDPTDQALCLVLTGPAAIGGLVPAAGQSLLAGLVDDLGNALDRQLALDPGPAAGCNRARAQGGAPGRRAWSSQKSRCRANGFLASASDSS
jgi:hypothetical protein